MNTDPNDSGKRDVIRDNLIHYEKGLELAEAGRHWQALEYMQEHLRRTPNDAEVLNDTGAILHCLGRSDEAIDHFVNSRNKGLAAEADIGIIKDPESLMPVRYEN